MTEFSIYLLTDPPITSAGGPLLYDDAISFTSCRSKLDPMDVEL